MGEKKILTDEELGKVVGGQVDYPESAGFKVEVNGHYLNVVGEDWGGPCHALGHNPDYFNANYKPHWCENCREYREIKDLGLGVDSINGWKGYCIWEG